MQICSLQDQRQCGALHLPFSSVGTNGVNLVFETNYQISGRSKTGAQRRVASGLRDKSFIYYDLRVNPAEIASVR